MIVLMPNQTDPIKKKVIAFYRTLYFISFLIKCRIDNVKHNNYVVRFALRLAHHTYTIRPLIKHTHTSKPISLNVLDGIFNSFTL